MTELIEKGKRKIEHMQTSSNWNQLFRKLKHDDHKAARKQNFCLGGGGCDRKQTVQAIYILPNIRGRGGKRWISVYLDLFGGIKYTRSFQNKKVRNKKLMEV